LDLGYWIHVDHIGQGYAQELARGLTEAAFGVEGIDRVEIHHDKANERSRGVPMALGFVRGPEQPDEVGAPGDVGIDCTWSISRGVDRSPSTIASEWVNSPPRRRGNVKCERLSS
jgi:ribosomal-protein-serine acetyltransferase